MSIDWLGYPQVVIALWGPLAVLSGWHAAKRVIRRLPPRERFFLAVLVSMTPFLAMSVPYLPESPLRDAVPWRAPLAWGISNPVLVDGDDLLTVVACEVLLLLFVLPIASLAASFALGFAQVIRGARRVAALAPERRDDLWLVRSREKVACTVGLFRPHIVLDRATAESAAAPAIIEHERAHARARHPLWIFLATCLLRAWWWIPGRRAVLAEVRLAAELWADERARAALGAPAVARALRAQVDAMAGRDLVPTGTGFLDPHVELVHRAHALAAAPKNLPAWRTWAVRAAAALAAGLVVVLL
ncbi:hypothetical protein SAMN05421805_102325 [Saccharopolyspora antimicrobica]|uniref:Signal transducer regulating beta-lactamase production, contains metallopeptidase domain n=1 Tax=Saccharopolyspora antimicrobica TaxID=455193 RepID=A0A1I4VQ48_9PSEU|nr:M56 family metallopeptidase [Saccharopolyspora antimicrobica]RKT87262.1 hypothetical protein ATL45_5662 [Saccharopolyspora antimicrobica]SFN03454.1 hypothetical protein SAMN05421805_102325 [Saccharopolyspora antimicrobica]